MSDWQTKDALARISEKAAMRKDRFLRCVDLIQRINEWGELHIVVSDGNVDDENLTYCSCKSGLTNDEKDFLELMGWLDLEDRILVWEHRK